jgi:hypothetical protein
MMEGPQANASGSAMRAFDLPQRPICSRGHRIFDRSVGGFSSEHASIRSAVGRKKLWARVVGKIAIPEQ